MEKVIILGTGPAGLTAAIYLARANMNPVVIEGVEPGGQLSLTTEVENFPGFIDGVMGPELISNMRKQAEKFGAVFKSGWVTDVDLKQKPFTLQVSGIGEMKTESLIISTGASARMLNIPGEKENIGRGVSTCATCDGFFFRGKKVVIVGGGDSAMEEANFLSKFASEVEIIHRRHELRASKIMQERAKENEKIKWSLNKTPIEVVSEENKVKGIMVKNNDTNKEEMIETEGLFVAIGHNPNTKFLKGQIETDEVGYIQVVPGTTEANVPGVFACGDVQDNKYRQAITAAGTGCMAALDVERYIEGNMAQEWSQSLSEKV
ncbi:MULTISPECIES: thioredoxin-disulfide reductase [unclassified Oceanobacillus]|uniref:thioredoxin-disulfide reductase n=1 Tax=unclassified Oceanobacillus TaxID=2630292 RepID=UPI001BE5990E|nr:MULTISPECIES: thioredoxin-disulfide reductase [unclassified Oceanobacillus]MBT2601117.1 thioredoxin-disulfide reductase [Oceanobacillus sp. ISL-74]MBT2652343.1 thioredoxin-disulfide reductase [Oceanobacillus sp. ISL-73]